MVQSYKVIIILVNWNGSIDTLECIESLNQSTLSSYRIIVVDNGSTLENLQILKSSSYKFDLIETGKNLGYTGGNNAGITEAIKFNSEYILLLNNDTIVKEDTLLNLSVAADLVPDAGLISPKILFYPEKNLIWSADANFNYFTLMGKMIGYKKKDIDIYNNAKYTDYITGCAMLIRKEVIDRIGMLDDNFFATCEDIDYCLRAKSNGYNIFYAPSSVVYHKEAASSGSYDSPQYTYYTTRGYFLLHNKWAKNFIHLIFSQLYYFLYCLKRVLNFMFNGNLKGILAIFFAIKDSIFGKYGFREYPSLITKSKQFRKEIEN